tara:strand:+ start:117 stop:503 length:387 start_codon:yes stop_codon:yes gene_type:complete
MGWIPTKEEIADEAKNYKDVKFFAKTKNQLLIFILIVSGISIFFIGSFDISWVGIAIYLVLAGFIYLNHRWAIVVFALMYLADKILIISMGARPTTSIIFGAVALVLSYSAYRVATELKKQKGHQPDD